MMRKISIIGRGTAGALSLIHYLRWTDWNIDWYFDDKIEPQSVGEGSFPNLPSDLFQTMNFNFDDLESIDGTIKLGIHKINWGGSGDFKHYFFGDSLGYHFNAIKLQDFIFSYVKHNNRVRIIHSNVKEHDQLDCDYVMDCSGRPKSFENYHLCEYIPVNSVYVTQCFWDRPKFNYTLTIARPYGWVFGIPLQNRCSIGYLYNNDISTLDEVKEDVKEVFRKIDLQPSNTTNSFSFKSYHRLSNYSSRIAYNGNSSFFLEPLEATSISMMGYIKRCFFDVCNGNISVEQANEKFSKKNYEVENMIMLHYLSGSKFDTEFWRFAKERGRECFEQRTTKDEDFFSTVRGVEDDLNYGFWPYLSYRDNLAGLGLNKYIKNDE